MHSFEKFLTVCVESIEFELRGYAAVEWSNFLLNPRRLRGSDFLMRWSQGVWSEERITQAVNATEQFFALPYGPSGTAPDDDVRAFELYFERLEQAGLGKVKRPDLLVFRKSDSAGILKTVAHLGGVQELPFIREDNSDMQEILGRAIIAVECENSLWVARQMPDYGIRLRPMRRLGGKLGLKKKPVLPTIIMKEEDRAPLHEWQTKHEIDIHIWHVFYDMAFGITFDKAEELIADGLIEPTEHTFQAPNGAQSKKVLYQFYHHYAYPLGNSQEQPTLTATSIVDKNGHILPYVRFEGGLMALTPEALDVLNRASNAKD